MSGKLNPKIRETKAGIRTERTFSVYPMSYRDQKKFMNEILEAWTTFSAAGQDDQTEGNIVTKLVDILDEKLELLFATVTDFEGSEIDTVLSDMDNDQLVDFIQIVWEVNYETPFLKKEVSFLKSLRKMFNEKSPMPLLQQSSGDTLNIQSLTSSRKGSKKAASRKSK